MVIITQNRLFAEHPLQSNMVFESQFSFQFNWFFDMNTKHTNLLGTKKTQIYCNKRMRLQMQSKNEVQSGTVINLKVKYTLLKLFADGMSLSKWNLQFLEVFKTNLCEKKCEIVQMPQLLSHFLCKIIYLWDDPASTLNFSDQLNTTQKLNTTKVIWRWRCHLSSRLKC